MPLFIGRSRADLVGQRRTRHFDTDVGQRRLRGLHDDPGERCLSVRERRCKQDCGGQDGGVSESGHGRTSVT